MWHDRVIGADALLDVLPDGFHMESIRTKKINCDWMTGENKYLVSDLVFITSLTDIISVLYEYGLWQCVLVKTKDDEFKLLSSNINSDDTKAIRITENNFFSPYIILTTNKNYIKLNNELEKWISFNVGDIYQKYVETVTYSEFRIFKNVNTRHYDSNGNFTGCTELKPLILNDAEIENALNNIQDSIMRCRIRDIVYDNSKIYYLESE